MRNAHRVATLVACTGVLATTSVARAVDMSAVTGPFPGSVQTATTCTGRQVPVAPVARLGEASSSRGSVDGTITLSQTWTKCDQNAVARSIGASIEIHLPRGSGGPDAPPAASAHVFR